MRVRLAVLAAGAVTVLLATPGGAGASCVPQSATEQQARAQVIVDGVILAGAKPGDTRLRVSRYLKGNGPRELAIVGAGGRGGALSSVDIEPSAGERWRIFGSLSGAGAVLTTVCDGSALIDELAPSESVDRGPAAPVESGDGTLAWLVGVWLAVGMAALVALWPRRSRWTDRTSHGMPVQP